MAGAGSWCYSMGASATRAVTFTVYLSWPTQVIPIPFGPFPGRAGMEIRTVPAPKKPPLER